jgi:hypothetical protein
MTATRQRPTGPYARPLGNAAGPFYNGTPGREVVPCPDCKLPADALFGDHGGDCVDLAFLATPKSALGIIRKHALKMHRLSINDLRPAFDKAGVRDSSRGPAFATAVRRDWLEPDGSIPSTDPATKGHHIRTYRSLIHPDRARVAAARAER